MERKKKWIIKTSEEGHLYCDCPSWKFQQAPPQHRVCKHIRHYLQMKRTKQELTGEEEYAAGEEGNLESVIEQAIKDLGQSHYAGDMG